MAPRAGILMLVLLLSGCGGDSPSGPASPATPEAPVQQCRRYATALTSVSTTFAAGLTISSEESGTCTFDGVSTTLRCTYTDSDSHCPGTRTTSTTYASLLDFIEEAAVVGRFRHQRFQVLTSSCRGNVNATENNTYDDTKRPLTREYASSRGIRTSSTFTAWDALGRPTEEISSSLTCAHNRWALTYDDVARTWISRLTQPGTGQGCSSDSTYTVTYDPDGNVVRQVSTYRGATSWVSTSTITSTETVCY